MRPASENMKDKINNTKFKKPWLTIVNNVTAQPENDPDIIKLLIDQIFSTVKWRESLVNINSNNVTQFVEVGPGLKNKKV